MNSSCSIANNVSWFLSYKTVNLEKVTLNPEEYYPDSIEIMRRSSSAFGETDKSIHDFRLNL